MPTSRRNSHCLRCRRKNDSIDVHRLALGDMPRLGGSHLLEFPHEPRRGDAASPKDRKSRRRLSFSGCTHGDKSEGNTLPQEQTKTHHRTCRRSHSSHCIHTEEPSPWRDPSPKFSAALAVPSVPTATPLPIAIIGAGLSGLYAAYCLKGYGVPFTIFEAEEGAGGVLRSTRLMQGGGLIHGGPDLLWPAQRLATHLVDKLGLQKQSLHSRGSFLTWHCGSRFSHSPPTGTLWENLDAYSLHGGLRSLSNALLEKVEQHAHFGTRLLRMRHADGMWRLRFNCRGEIFEQKARAVILAVPPSVAATVVDLSTFSPRFEQSLLKVIRDASVCAFHVKFIAIYDQPFWRTADFSGIAKRQDGPLQIVYDGGIVRHHRFAIIGLASRRPKDPFYFEKTALAQLAVLFGPETKAPCDAFLLDWSCRPWKANFPAYGSQQKQRKCKVKECYHPQGALPFILASAEMALGDQAGNVEGALFSGARAAQFVRNA